MYPPLERLGGLAEVVWAGFIYHQESALTDHELAVVNFGNETETILFLVY